jgi:hypothetical protein
MNDEKTLVSPDLQKIRRASKKLDLLCLLALFVLPTLVPFVWMSDTSALAQLANLAPSSIQNPIQSWQRVAGILFTEIPVTLMCVGLWQARKCFQEFSKGEIFTDKAAVYLKKFSVWMMRSAIAALIVSALLSSILTLGNAPGSRILSIAVSTEQVVLLFFSCVVWLMAEIIRQGQALAKENSSFI